MQLISFVKESWLELKQVSWLTVPQMVASTIVVVIMVALMGAYIFCIDKILGFVLSFIYV